MPLIQIREINEHTRLGLWQISETTAELATIFGKMRPEQAILAATNENRRREWLASRILAYLLLQDFTSYPHALHSDENGKPVFPGTIFQVSISQSGNRAAVLLSSCYQVGIDLEIIREKALKLSVKFLSEPELEATNKDLVKTCLYWSAKETLYKMYSRKKLLFRENLRLAPLPQPETGLLQGTVAAENFNQNYDVHYEKGPEYILTYCLALPLLQN